MAICVDSTNPSANAGAMVRPLGALEPGWEDRLAALKDLGQKNALVRNLIADHSGWIATNSTRSEP